MISFFKKNLWEKKVRHAFRVKKAIESTGSTSYPTSRRREFLYRIDVLRNRLKNGKIGNRAFAKLLVKMENGKKLSWEEQYFLSTVEFKGIPVKTYRQIVDRKKTNAYPLRNGGSDFNFPVADVRPFDLSSLDLKTLRYLYGKKFPVNFEGVPLVYEGQIRFENNRYGRYLGACNEAER